MQPLISIVISTKNRCRDLLHTLHECHKLNLKNSEILLIDDGSADETSKMVALEYPEVRILRFDNSEGLIKRRNDGANFAAGQFIVSLDDDSWFLDSDALETTVKLFESYPQVGALAYWAFDPVAKDSLPEPRAEEELVREFIGCGHALRRSVFLQLGGYRPFFHYGGEESEYCLRLMDAGYYILHTRRIRVFHNQSAVERNIRERHVSAYRNQLLSTVLNEPWERALPHLLVLAIKGFVFAGKRCLLSSYWRAWMSFLAFLPQCLSIRQPLRRKVFIYCDKLRKRRLLVNLASDIIGL
jgi:GT2 family glycosyltransferase